ncbi:MAG: TonB family protein, partial [Phocaeicola sp.]|nr:TonB family protein [Phocaeicola sp.]
EIPEGSTLVSSYVGYGTKEFLVRPGVTEINGVMEKDNSDAAGQTKREVRVVGIGEQKGMDSTPVFQVVEEMPEFPGGMAECLKFLAQNIKYPVEAQQEGIQGKVIAQFVVEKDGSISNPIVLRSIDPRLDGEAIRVVSIMPKWKPGMQEGQLVRVKYTIPISFSLNKKEPSEVASMDMDIRFDGKRPLVVMDGQKVAWDTIQRLDPSKIESFHILGESRTKESYGEEGKDGVILITTKKEKKK